MQQVVCAVPIITVTPTSGTCIGNGVITVTVSGATGPAILYAIRKVGTTVFSPQQESNVFSNLASGSYEVAVYDGSGETISAPVTLTNASYIPMSVTNMVVGNIVTTACVDDGSVAITVAGGNVPLTFHLKDGPSQPADIVITNRTAQFTQLATGTYNLDITDACGNSITASNIKIVSKYNLNGVDLGSVDLQGTLESSTGCDLNVSFSTNNLLLKDVNGKTYFKRDSNMIPSGYPIEIRLEYPSGSGNYTPWQNIFSTFTIPSTDYFPANSKFKVQLKNPCNENDLVTSSEYSFKVPYSSIGGYCAPSIIRNINTYNCGPVSIRIKHSTKTDEKTFIWDGVNPAAFPIDFTGLSTGTYSVFITTKNGTYQSNNISTTTLSSVNTAYIYNYITTLGCDFTTGGLRSYGIDADNTVPITYSILSGPVTRPSVTSTKDVNPIWNDLPAGTYVVEFKFGDCNKSTRTYTISPPFGGFNADEVSYIPGSSCGKYLLTGKGWYLAPDGSVSTKTDTYQARIFDMTGKSLGSSPPTINNTSFTTLNTTTPKTTVEVGPGTYRISFLNAANSQEKCYYVDKYITIPPYNSVSIDLSKSGGVACDNGFGELHVEPQGGSGKTLYYRIKPAGTSDNNYTAEQTSQDFSNLQAGNYTVQIRDECGAVFTGDITLIRTTTVSGIGITGAEVNGRNALVCEGNTVTLKLNVIGRVIDIQWIKPDNSVVNNASYSISNFSAADEGKYVVSYSSGGCIRKDSVTLALKPKPSLTSSLNPTAICSSTNFTYTPQSTIAGTTFSWSRAAIQGINEPAGSGTGTINEVLTNSTAQSIDVTYKYTLSYNGCDSTQNVVVRVYRKAAANDIISTDTTICENSTATLKVGTSIANPVFTWYSDAGLTNQIATGTTFLTPSLSATTSYYVVVSGTEVCTTTSANAKVVTAYVNRKATATDIISTDQRICSGSSTTLTASSTLSNAIFKWYADAGLSSLIAQGNDFTTPTLWGSRSYFVTVTNNAVCENAPNTAKEVKIIVREKAKPDAIVAPDQTICVGEQASLSATSTLANATFRWYSDAQHTTFLGEGATFLTPRLLSDTTFYVTVSNAEICENAADSAKAVSITVNRRGQSADIIGPDEVIICSGEQTNIQLSTTISNPTIRLYSDAALNNLVASGNSINYTTAALTQTTNYYAVVTGDGVCENFPPFRKITVIVNERATAAAISVSDVSLTCTNETALLTASSTLTNPLFKWYADAALQNQVGTGESFITPPLTQTTTYYVTVNAEGVCENLPQTAKAVVVSVSSENDQPNVIINDVTICEGASTELAIVSNLKNPTYLWFSDASRTQQIHAGNLYSTPGLSTTTTYYITASGEGVCSNVPNQTLIRVEKSVTVHVNPKAILNDISTVVAPVCINEQATITASSATIANPEFKWYADNTLTHYLSTGPIYLTESLLSTTTYYVTVNGTGVCENDPVNAHAVTVIVNRRAVSSDIVVNNKSVCKGESTFLEARSISITNPVFKWYKQADLSDTPTEGPSYTTDALTQSTIFYVTVSGDNVCENRPVTAKQVVVTVDPSPNLVINAVIPINCNASTDNPPTFDITNNSITAGSDQGILSYWVDANAAQPLTNPKAIAVAGTYYIKLLNTYGCSTVEPITVPVVSKPLLVINNPNPVCNGGFIDLSQTSITNGSEAGLIFSYYADIEQSTPLLNYQHITKAGTYYIAASKSAGCVSIKPVVVSFNELPLLTISNPTSVCSPQTVNITTDEITQGSDVGQLSYWSDVAATMALSTPGTIAQTGTYYIKLTNANSCETIKPVNVVVNPLPNLVITDPAAVCSPQTVDLTAAEIVMGSTGGAQPPINPYDYWQDANGKLPLMNPQNIATSGTYYISYKTDAGCSVIKPVNVIVTPRSTATDIIASNAVICSGNSASLTVGSSTITNPVFKWYTDAALSKLRYIGQNFTTGILQADTNYYVTVSGDEICETPVNEAKLVSVIIQRNATALDIQSADVIICAGENAVLSASSQFVQAPIFNWYADAGLTQHLFTGANYQTTVLWSSHTYYVTISGNGVCENLPNSAKQVVVIVNRNATENDITGSNASICYNSSAMLSVSSSIQSPQFNWYSDAQLTNFLSSGATYTTPPLTANASFYVTVSGIGVCANGPDSAKVINVEVNRTGLAADISGITNATICKDEKVSIDLNTTIANATINLYADAQLTNKLATGVGGLNFISPALTASSTYFATVVGNNVCENLPADAKVITITVNERSVATDLTATDTSLACTNESVALTASSTLTNPQFKWYSDGALQNEVASGPIFNTPALLQTTDYYVTVSGDGVCESTPATAKKVTVAINSAITPAINIPGTTICAGESTTLIASGNLKNVTYSWFSDANHTPPALFIGKTFNTPVLTAATTYYVVATGDGVCENITGPGAVRIEQSVTVNVNRRGLKADIIVDNAEICSSEQITLTATSSTVSNPEFKWYKESTLTTLLATGNSYTTNALTNGTYQYYVTINGDNVCESTAPEAQSITVTVNRNGIASDITLDNTESCEGTVVTLQPTTTIVNPVFKWYEDAALTKLLFTGASFTPPTLLSSIVYYVTVSGTGVCENTPGNAKAVTVNVLRRSTKNDIITGDRIVCNGSAAILIAYSNTINSPVFKWYADAQLTNLLFTGQQYSTDALSDTTSFYVTVSGQSICETAVSEAKEVKVFVNRKAVATDVLVSDTTICYNNSVELKVNNSNIGDPVFNWYSDSGLTDYLHTGSSYQTPLLTTSTAYYVTVSGLGVCENSPLAAKQILVNVKRLATENDIIVTDTLKECRGTAVSLHASTQTITNPVFRWYADAALANLLHTGADYTTVALTNDVTYYVTVSGDNICANLPGTGKPVTIIMKQVATATDITIGDTTICEGSRAVLEAVSSTVTDPVFRWYADENLTTLLASGTSYTTPVLINNQAVYLTVSSDNVCENRPFTAKKVNITVNKLPLSGDIMVTDQQICAGGTATLQASSTTITNPVFNWYTDPDLSTLVFTGANFVTPVLTSTTNYYLTISGTGYCESKTTDAKRVSVIVNPLASGNDILIPETEICAGSSVTLTASSTTIANPVFKWYSDAALTQVVFTGSVYQIPVLWSTQKYYVSVTGLNTCENVSGNAKEVTITVNRKANATDLIAADQRTCSAGQAVLTASSSIANANFTWYQDAQLTNYLGSGATYTTPLLITNTTYYVTVSGTGICENAPDSAKAVQVIADRTGRAADIIGPNEMTICKGEAVTLNLTTDIQNPILKLFSDAKLTNLVASGSTINYTTPVLNSSATYYASVNGEGVCDNLLSEVKQVHIVVNETAHQNDVTVSDTSLICTGESVTLTATSVLNKPVFRWYADASLTTLVANGQSFTTPPLTQTTQYYVTVSGEGVCESDLANAKMVVVALNDKATPVLTISSATICKGDGAELTASSNLKNPVYNWYDDAAHSKLVFTGKIFETPLLNSSTTYYVVASGDGICDNLAAPGSVQIEKTTTVNVNTRGIASDIQVPQVEICSGSQAILTASSSTIVNPVFKWYADAGLVNYLGSGSDFTTESLRTSTTFYVTVSNAISICENLAQDALPVNVIVDRHGATADIIATNESSCYGESVTLNVSSATVANPVFKWYADAALTQLIFTGNRYQTPNLTQSVSYHVTVNGSGVCENTVISSKEIIVTVAPQLQKSSTYFLTPSVESVIAGSSVTLSVNSDLSQFIWERNGQVLPGVVGKTLTIPSFQLADTGAYYITAIDKFGCQLYRVDTVQLNLLDYTTWKTVEDESKNNLAAAGELLTYTIHLKNTGTANLATIKISDPLPLHTTYVNGGTFVNSIISFTDTQLKVNEERTYTFSVRANQDLANVSLISNQASVTADFLNKPTGCSVNQPNCTTDIPVEQQVSNFSTWKTVSDNNLDKKAQQNEELTYTIHVKNTGNTIIQILTVTDPIPLHTTFVSGGSVIGNSVIFTDVNLNVNEERTYVFKVKTDADLTGITLISNQAIVNGGGAERRTTCTPDTSVPVCTTDIPAEQQIKDFITWKTVTDASGDLLVQPNEELTYLIHVKNTGNATMSTVVISDPIPAHTSYLSGGAINGNNINFNDINLLINEERTYEFKVKAAAVLNGVNVISNQANVTADAIEHPTGCTSITPNCTTDIPVDKKVPLVIPNVFTPNGDGINDVFKIEGLENYPGSPLLIINRWGNEVYRQDNYTNDWDGSQLPEGVYYYILRINSSDLSKKKYTGYIEIIRNLAK